MMMLKPVWHGARTTITSWGRMGRAGGGWYVPTISESTRKVEAERPGGQEFKVILIYHNEFKTNLGYK